MCSTQGQMPCMPPSIRSALTGHKPVYSVVPKAELIARVLACIKDHCHAVLRTTRVGAWGADCIACFGSIFSAIHELVVGTVHACSTFVPQACMRMQDLQIVSSIPVQHNLITSIRVVMHENIAFGVAGPNRCCGYL